MFWSIQNSGKVLSKLKSRQFRATSFSFFIFLRASVPHNPIISFAISQRCVSLFVFLFFVGVVFQI